MPAFLLPALAAAAGAVKADESPDAGALKGSVRELLSEQSALAAGEGSIDRGASAAVHLPLQPPQREPRPGLPCAPPILSLACCRRCCVDVVSLIKALSKLSGLSRCADARAVEMRCVCVDCGRRTLFAHNVLPASVAGCCRGLLGTISHDAAVHSVINGS